MWTTFRKGIKNCKTTALTSEFQAQQHIRGSPQKYHQKRVCIVTIFYFIWLVFNSKKKMFSQKRKSNSIAGKCAKWPSNDLVSQFFWPSLITSELNLYCHPLTFVWHDERDRRNRIEIIFLAPSNIFPIILLGFIWN